MSTKLAVIERSNEDNILHRNVMYWLKGIYSWQDALQAAALELTDDRKRLLEELDELRDMVRERSR